MSLDRDKYQAAEEISVRRERKSIQRVVLEKGVKEIGDFAFCNLPNLTSVELHPDLERIGEGAFMKCPQLKAITIPEGVTVEHNLCELNAI